MTKHVAHKKHPRLTASVWGALLQLHIPTHRTTIEVRHPNGDLATTVTSREASLATYRGMVAGRIEKNILRYLILRCPKSTLVRVLAMDPPRRPDEISIRRTTGLKWGERLDRAKMGTSGTRHQVWMTP